MEVKMKTILILIPEDLTNHTNVDEFSDTLGEYVKYGFKNIIIDLSLIKWMKMDAIGPMMVCLVALRKRNGILKISNLQEIVKQTLKVTNLDTLFDIYDSIDDAIASF